MIKPINSLETTIAVTDVERSVAWYKKHFGLEKVSEDANGVVIGHGAIRISIMQGRDEEPVMDLESVTQTDLRFLTFEVSEADWELVKDEFPEDDGLSWIQRETYSSCITKDLDGHAIELYLKK